MKIKSINHLNYLLQPSKTDDIFDFNDFSFLHRSISITLRTFLNQEYKCRISSDKTIYELKEIIGKQENLEPNRIILTKIGNYFDQLDDNRTLKFYDCDSTTVLMICVRK
jgi:hypothetical protein